MTTAFKGSTTGKISMMRVLSAVIVGTAMGLWIIASIRCWVTGCAWIPPDAQTVTLVLGTLAAKAGQRAVEKTNDIPTDKGE